MPDFDPVYVKGDGATAGWPMTLDLIVRTAALATAGRSVANFRNSKRVTCLPAATAYVTGDCNTASEM